MEKYEEIVIEVIEFEGDDVITASDLLTKPLWSPADDDSE